jgi:lysophospholipase L1-like esterase
MAATLRAEQTWASEITEHPLVNAEDSKNLVILFQGDSITDGGRGRDKDPNHVMGHGYAFSVASRVGADFPQLNLSFYNRGIGGNNLIDIKKRWQTDTLDLKPDVLSILTGINDARYFSKKNIKGEEAYNQFEENYRDILSRSKQENPDTLFILCLPFVYPVGFYKDNWDYYKNTVDQLALRIKKLGKEFDALVVDFPSVFDKASKKAPIEYWMWDGIHPTVAGHELMAREWITKVRARLKFLKTYKY